MLTACFPRLVTNIKRAAQELLAVTSLTDNGVEMARKGFTLCRNLQQVTMEVEELLITPKSSITWSRGLDVLTKSTTPFIELEKYNEELMALHRLYVPKTKRSSGSRDTES